MEVGGKGKGKGNAKDSDGWVVFTANLPYLTLGFHAWLVPVRGWLGSFVVLDPQQQHHYLR